MALSQSTLDAITAAVAAAFAAAQPATAAPAQAEARSPFIQFLADKNAAKVACEIHPAKVCNRRFTATNESGRRSHNAEMRKRAKV